MIPGITTKLSLEVIQSAETIHAKTDILLVKGSVPIKFIRPYFGGSSGMVFIVAFDAGLTILGTGNVHLGGAIPQGRVVALLHLAATGPNWQMGPLPV